MVLGGEVKTVRASALGINRKNIYRSSKLQIKDRLLAKKIERVHQDNPAYGHRRVAWELGINPKRALRVMNKFGLKPPRRKVKHFCTRSTSHHNYNNLIQDLEINQPHQAWCSDVSYIKFQGKFWYLMTIEDLVTRQIMAAQIGKQHNAQLVLSTIKQALVKTTPQIFHSDQGTEFMAKACTKLLESNGIQVSVSDTASPWQNGYQESFFGRFKDEFGDFNRFNHIGELIEEVYSQVHYYNYKRRHTAFKISPVDYAATFSDYCLHKRGA